MLVLSLIDKFVRLLQPEKVKEGISFSVVGIEIDWRFSHDLKHPIPIRFKPSGSEIERRFLHSQKQNRPIETTVGGIFNETKLSQPKKTISTNLL